MRKAITIFLSACASAPKSKQPAVQQDVAFAEEIVHTLHPKGVTVKQIL